MRLIKKQLDLNVRENFYRRVDNECFEKAQAHIPDDLRLSIFKLMGEVVRRSLSSVRVEIDPVGRKITEHSENRVFGWRPL
jgi:hypothetical protein